MNIFIPLLAVFLAVCVNGGTIQHGKDSSKARVSRIVGGEDALPNEFPYQASLQVSSHRCGAVIISEDWLVTAAHCVDGTTPSSLKIKVGLNKLNEPDIPLRSVSSFTQHPDWEPLGDGFPNDVAVIKLDEPLEFDEKIKKIDMADEAQGDFADYDCILSGWGLTNVDLTEKAKCMHNEINNYLDNYKENCSSQLLRANDVHLIPFLATSLKDDIPPESKIDDLANYLCANYPRLKDLSSQDVSSFLHNTVQFIINYRQGGTPNSSYVESEESSTVKASTGIIDIDCSTILCESIVIDVPKEPVSIDLSAEKSTSSISESNSGSSLPCISEGKRRKVSLNDLQTMQYEVLKKQKAQIDLHNIKTQKEIDREKLKATNLRLQNKKLRLEIQMMKEKISAVQ